MERPNIIIIFCDDLGYGDIGCYGSEVNRTPVIDQLAKEGIQFTDFYVTSPVCSPSRSSLMTGCYPKRVGLDSGDDYGVLLPGDPIGLNPDEVTVADVLKESGYSTKMIGKWHLGNRREYWPTRHGFESFTGCHIPTTCRILHSTVMSRRLSSQWSRAPRDCQSIA